MDSARWRCDGHTIRSDTSRLLARSLVAIADYQNNFLTPHFSRSTDKTPAARGDFRPGITIACSPTSSTEHSTPTPPSHIPGLDDQSLTSDIFRPRSSLLESSNPTAQYHKPPEAIPAQFITWVLQELTTVPTPGKTIEFSTSAEIPPAASVNESTVGFVMSAHEGISSSPFWLERIGFSRPTKPQDEFTSLAKHPSITHPSLIDRK